MSLLRRGPRDDAALHVITVRVDDEPDLLKRIALLNTAMLQVLTGRRLIRTLEADYEAGCLRFLIEAAQITPSITPGRVHVEIDAWTDPHPDQPSS